jgi:hypothetical protein
MRDEQLRNIYMPYLNGLRQITPASRDEFIKANIKMYDNFDNQYKGVVAQRQHRADELGEARMRVLKYLWSVMISEHKMTQEELWDILKIEEENQKGVRKKEELPTMEAVK